MKKKKNEKLALILVQEGGQEGKTVRLFAHVNTFWSELRVPSPE